MATFVPGELGSRILAARLARDLMRLCLLLDRRYAPYSKWLGSAFARLEIAATLTGAVDQVVDSTDVLENAGVARKLASIYQ